MANYTYSSRVDGNTIYIDIKDNNIFIGTKSFDITFSSNIDGNELVGVEGALASTKFEGDNFGFFFNGKGYDKQDSIPPPPEPIPQPSSNTPTYVLGIENPNDKNKTYKQEIIFVKLGPKIKAVSTYPNDAPDGLKNTTIEGDFSFSSNYDILANELILIIENQFQNKGLDINLVTKEIKNPPKPVEPQPTPQSIENKREEEKAQRESNQAESESTPIDNTSVKENIPSNQKPKGQAKLGGLLQKSSLILVTKLTPIILKEIEKLKVEVKDKVIEEVDKFKKQKLAGCPVIPELDRIIKTRNEIVTKLNTFGTKIDTLDKTLGSLKTLTEVSNKIMLVISVSRIAMSNAVAAIPSPPGTPGSITSALTNLKTLEDIVKPKIDKANFTIGSISMGIGLASSNINKLLSLLSLLDAAINLVSALLGSNCSKELTSQMEPLSPTMQRVQNTQIQSQQINSELYNDFLIEIEEVPYTPTVTRRRAIGKNKDNIKLIQTELSFSTDNQTLIDELKLIIDRDNLKAN